MENQNVPIDMRKVNKHPKRNNKTVEGCNSKLNSIIGKQHPNVFLQVQKIRGEAEMVSWQSKSKEPGEPGQ